MKRILSAALVAAATSLALSGCGAAGCSSSPADIQPQNSTCSVAPGTTTATINVTICQKCTDTSPGCQAEFVSGTGLELGPTVQQCSDQSGCPTGGCNSASPTVACTVTFPSSSASYPIVIVGDTSTPSSATLTFDGSSSSCTL